MQATRIESLSALQNRKVVQSSAGGDNFLGRAVPFLMAYKKLWSYKCRRPNEGIPPFQLCKALSWAAELPLKLCSHSQIAQLYTSVSAYKNVACLQMSPI